MSGGPMLILQGRAWGRMSALGCADGPMQAEDEFSTRAPPYRKPTVPCHV